MPEESSNSPTLQANNPSVLDKPVPNPLAKNPNVHTHKVFATVGLILLGTILAAAGIWYYVEGRFSAPATTDNTTKVATSSAKPKTSTTSANSSSKKDETADWKTFTNSRDGYSVKYPATLFMGTSFGDVGFFTEYFSNYKYDPNVGLENCLNGPGKDISDCYDITVTKGPEASYVATKLAVNDSVTVGGSTTKRFSDVSYNEFTWMRFTQDGHGTYTYYLTTEVIKGSFYTIKVMSKNLEEVNSNKKIIELIASTFKFL